MILLRIFILISLLAYFGIFCHAQNVWIDPVILSKNSEEQQHVIVVLKEQADIRAVALVKGKNSKSSFVYTKLIETAYKSQVRISNFLKSQNVNFRPYYIVNCIALKANRQLIEVLSSYEEIDRIIEDGKYVMLPYEESRNKGERAIEWGVSKINAPQVWAMGNTGQGVVVGGQDTGYEWNHPAIINQYRGWNGSQASHNFNWHDAIYQNFPGNGGTNPCGYNLSVPCDDNNHGTHTAGTMAGDDGGNNQIGVAPGAKWIGCRNMERGLGILSTYMECFEWFLAPYAYGDIPTNGNPEMAPHVINNSWYCPQDEGCNSSNWGVMESIVNTLKAAGIFVVVSAGNSGPNCSTVSYPPAFFQNSFSVGATSSTDAIANFSSRGPVTIDNSNRLKPNVSAPGVNVRSCIRNGGYASYQGTSMAGPHVAGAVALIISANPDLAGEVELIESILEQTAFHPTHSQTCGNTPAGTWPNNTFGHGIIDVLAAVNMAKSMHINQRVNVSDSDIIFTDNLTGPVLKNFNGQYFRMKVNDAGIVTFESANSFASQKNRLSNTSVDLSQSSSGIILKSPNGSYFRITAGNNGSPMSTSILTMPDPIVASVDADLITDDTDFGFVLKSSSGKCYLWTVNNSGQLNIKEIVCME